MNRTMPSPYSLQRATLKCDCFLQPFQTYLLLTCYVSARPVVKCGQSSDTSHHIALHLSYPTSVVSSPSPTSVSCSKSSGRRLTLASASPGQKAQSKTTSKLDIKALCTFVVTVSEFHRNNPLLVNSQTCEETLQIKQWLAVTVYIFNMYYFYIFI